VQQLFLKPQPSLAIGIRTGEVVAIDIDLLNPDHAFLFVRLAEHSCGATPLIRVGSKGAVLIYRNIGDQIPKS
jgi:hypothetical protein